MFPANFVSDLIRRGSQYRKDIEYTLERRILYPIARSCLAQDWGRCARLLLAGPQLVIHVTSVCLVKIERHYKRQYCNLKARPHYSCSCYSLYTLRVNIRILTRRSLASNWSSVDEDLRAQVKARRAFRRAQAWRAPARARVMWTHLKRVEYSGMWRHVFW
jgi:hypothetical protein